MQDLALPEDIREYAEMQVRSGAYADLNEVVRACVRILMEADGVRQFHELRADLEQAAAQVEAGNHTVFEPEAFDSRAFHYQRSSG